MTRASQITEPENKVLQMPTELSLAVVLETSSVCVNYLQTSSDSCEFHGDVATASLIDVWKDEAERRQWFLAEIVANRKHETKYVRNHAHLKGRK